jgi:hypothetical protein
MLGGGIDHKVLTPRLVTNKNVAADATIGSTAFIGYARLVLDPVTVKAEGTYGTNLTDLLMLGGYAAGSIDTTTGVESYSGLKAYSVWGEISAGKEWELAVFAGYSQSLGANNNLAGVPYGRGTNIDKIFRISPRVVWNTGKVRVASECEYTSADYGTPNRMNKGIVENAKNVVNVRVLFAAYYFF